MTPPRNEERRQDANILKLLLIGLIIFDSNKLIPFPLNILPDPFVVTGQDMMDSLVKQLVGQALIVILEANEGGFAKIFLQFGEYFVVADLFDVAHPFGQVYFIVELLVMLKCFTLHVFCLLFTVVVEKCL